MILAIDDASTCKSLKGSETRTPVRPAESHTDLAWDAEDVDRDQGRIRGKALSVNGHTLAAQHAGA